MEIEGELPLITITSVRERVLALINNECVDYACPGGPGRFTKRLINGFMTVHLQCLGCGRSVSSSLKREAFPSWPDFPEWDDELPKSFQATRSHTYLEEAAKRREAYRTWLLTSPAWRALRDRVCERANGQCEACLQNLAEDVHHVTYSFGWLPPAWELRAVCRECHERLHDWKGTSPE